MTSTEAELSQTHGGSMADSITCIQYLWSVYQVLGTVLGAENAKINSVWSQLPSLPGGHSELAASLL